MVGAIPSRGGAEPLAEDANERRRSRKTTLIGDVLNLQVGTEQQVSCAVESLGEEPTVGALAIDLAEVALEARQAHIALRGKLIEGDVTVGIMEDVVFEARVVAAHNAGCVGCLRCQRA